MGVCHECERKFGFAEEKLDGFEKMGTFKLLKHHETHYKDPNELINKPVFDCTVRKRFKGKNDNKPIHCPFLTYSKRILKEQLHL